MKQTEATAGPSSLSVDYKANGVMRRCLLCDQRTATDNPAATGTRPLAWSREVRVDWDPRQSILDLAMRRQSLFYSRWGPTKKSVAQCN